MSQLICLAGLPGVGKTTWAQEFMENTKQSGNSL